MTIYDIAKLAGVSKSTVSRVLNEHPSVNDEVRERVIKVIRDNNYSPNKNAKGLTTTGAKSILIIMTRLASTSENKAVRGIVETAGENCDFQIYTSDFSVERTKQIISNNKNVNGIIIFAIGNESYDFLEGSLVPIVFIGQKLLNHKSVYYQDYDAISGIMSYVNDVKPLINVLHVGLQDQDPTTGLLRSLACEHYCREHNIGYDFIDCDFSSTNSYERIKNLDISKYQLIVCATDKVALGAYKRILLSDHHDIILSGIGNYEEINFIMDNFITVEMNYEKSGRDAFDLLFKNKQVTIKEGYQIISNI